MLGFQPDPNISWSNFRIILELFKMTFSDIDSFSMVTDPDHRVVNICSLWCGVMLIVIYSIIEHY
jgi:hypothetical protein